MSGLAKSGWLNRCAAIASISVALLLGALKGWAAWTTGSTAMLGSLADTLLDLIASMATLAGVWVAAQPDDAEHRFGHGKAEALAAMFQVDRQQQDHFRARWHCRFDDRAGCDIGAAGLAALCHPPHR
jgi:hypothetical protein